jgi:hypothetical protein
MGEGPDAVCTFLDYGPHGEGHGHFDKLNLMLYANQREWLLDPGRLDYSHKEYKTWVKTTAAHNTVTLGGESQQATTGKLLFLKEEKSFAACAAETDSAYPGAMLRRYLLLTKNMLVDVFDVQAPEATQIDWFAHAIVPALRPFEEPGAHTPSAPGTDEGYQHLVDGLMWKAPGASRWDFISDTANAAAPRWPLWLAGYQAEKFFPATGMGYNLGKKAPALIRRRNAKSTRFITVYDLGGKAEYIQKVDVLAGAAPRLKIATIDGTWQVGFTQIGATCTLTPKPAG